ncbi:MAG: DNA-directed RNA polymerase subunit omega [Terracidiphilus sp.]
MRSDLVFGALSHVSNRYQLCQLASKATRKLHKPNTRLQDTTNEVLVRFHVTNPGTAAPVKVSADQPQPVERRRAA